MLFSKQKLEQAFSYCAPYYDKIVEVDLVNNTFNPIRINSKEWAMMPPFAKFTQWVKWFIYGSYYEPATDRNADNLNHLLAIEALKERTTVFVCNYHKYIDNEWHVMQLELYPTPDKHAYLFVKDLTLMQRGITWGPI